MANHEWTSRRCPCALSTALAVTALVPASVRVRREQAAAAGPLSKPPPSASGFGLVPRTLQQPRVATGAAGAPAAAAAAAPSVDDKVNAFLAELEGL